MIGLSQKGGASLVFRCLTYTAAEEEGNSLSTIGPRQKTLLLLITENRTAEKQSIRSHDRNGIEQTLLTGEENMMRENVNKVAYDQGFFLCTLRLLRRQLKAW